MRQIIVKALGLGDRRAVAPVIENKPSSEILNSLKGSGTTLLRWIPNGKNYGLEEMVKA